MASEPDRSSDSQAERPANYPTAPAPAGGSQPSSEVTTSSGASSTHRIREELQESAEPLDPVGRIKRWVLSRGWSGFIVVLLFVGWWEWDHIEKLPFVQYALSLAVRKPVPRASADKFAIAVAHLEDDTDRRDEKLLLAELEKFDGVDILQIDRTIQLPSGETEQESLVRGYAEARSLLQRSNAQVLLWGSVLHHDQRSALQLRWTIAPSETRRRGQTGRYLPDEDLTLPLVFWDDLTNILGLLVQSHLETLRAGTGTYQVNRLKPFIAATRQLLAMQNIHWQTKQRASVEFALAYALRVLGEQAGDNSALQEAIARSRFAGDQWTRSEAPLQWAMAQNNLGAALGILGERESGTQHLEEAVAVFRAALQERTRERVPLGSAATQNNLGNTLQILGRHQSGTQYLQEAVAAYRAALEERTRERFPLDWARTQNNLGSTLVIIGERESGTQHLQEAAAAYRAILQEQTRERVPLEWAMAQSNLGNALRILGERESGTQHLQEAVGAYRAALEERKRERVPLAWAATENSLGIALQILGEREPGTQHLQEAVTAYRAALQEQTRKRVPLDWATTQNNLGNTLQILGRRESGTQHLREAVAAFRAALQEQTRERVPLDWARTQNNLGKALQILGRRESRGNVFRWTGPEHRTT
jgi:tetratricopeptide (TPR) repeat protein